MSDKKEPQKHLKKIAIFKLARFFKFPKFSKFSSFFKSAKNLSASIKQKIPADCLVCKDFALKELDLCKACFADIKTNELACDICSEPFDAKYFITKNDRNICGACASEAPNYEKMQAFFLYQPPLENILWEFKFDANILAGNVLLHLLLQKQAQAPLTNCLIISMPKNINHDYAQKLDSVYWLANKLAQAWDCEILPDDYIIRKQNIPAQRGLSLKQRSKNMNNAWTFKEEQKLKLKLKDRNILLFDDVATTGASINFLAKRLKKFQPKTIQALCVLRTSKDR